MAKTVTVVALQPFAHGGRTYRCGEPVVLAPLDAAIYARQQYVSLATVAEMPDPVDPPVRPRRRYRRRDLVAET